MFMPSAATALAKCDLSQCMGNFCSSRSWSRIKSAMARRRYGISVASPSRRLSWSKGISQLYVIECTTSGGMSLEENRRLRLVVWTFGEGVPLFVKIEVAAMVQFGNRRVDLI